MTGVRTCFFLVLSACLPASAVGQEKNEVLTQIREILGAKSAPCADNNRCYCVRLPLKDVRFTKAQVCPERAESGAIVLLKFRSWDEAGSKIDEGPYLNGKMDGIWTSWHPNGAKAAESKYVDGKQDGPFTTWHDNGRVAVQGRYKKGQPHAEWSYWDPSGKLTRQLVWDDGKLLSKRKFK